MKTGPLAPAGIPWRELGRHLRVMHRFGQHPTNAVHARRVLCLQLFSKLRDHVRGDDPLLPAKHDAIGADPCTFVVHEARLVRPKLASKLFGEIGYGWGMSVFGILSIILMPAPMIFYWTGKRLREKFTFDS